MAMQWLRHRSASRRAAECASVHAASRGTPLSGWRRRVGLARRAWPAFLVLAYAGCAPAVTRPVPSAPGGPNLPPIPVHNGTLKLYVGYPRDSMHIAVRDTNFIFGSTGRGDAQLQIDGRPVPVQPNGAFLAFLPVPQDGVYHLEARANGQVDSLRRVVLLPDSLPPAPDTMAILPGSMYPTGARVALPHERIEVGFRGTAGGTATLLLPGGAPVPMVETPAEADQVGRNFSVNPGQAGRGTVGGWSDYRGFFAARRLFTLDTLVAWPSLTSEWRPVLAYRVPPPPDDSAAVLELVRGADTLRATLPLNLLLADPDRPRVGFAWDARPPAANGDGEIIGRPGPGSGPYNYFWVNGTRLELTGQRGSTYRVHLADGLDAWSNMSDVSLTVPATPPPESRVDLVRLVPAPDHVDVHVALHAPLPYRVEEGDHQIRLVVFGADSRVEFLQHGAVDPFIRRAEWHQPADGVFRVTVFTSRTPWGYDVHREKNGDLVLRIRKPPHIDPEQPFRGLTVAVDPGHGGSDRATVGPTGLTEADANLAVARRLVALLEQAGARVVMTRSTDSTVSLVQRTDYATLQNADILVSVHNNAFPDGVNPWQNNGTSTYYFHPWSASLAWSVQRHLLDALGLRDLGVGRADLALARPTWMPAILTETMFMMIPRQENALRDRAVQDRIARAQLLGIREFLLQRAAEAGP
jgi:N-acetylmuramoyl-L-alanine amidase